MNHHSAFVSSQTFLFYTCKSTSCNSCRRALGNSFVPIRNRKTFLNTVLLRPPGNKSRDVTSWKAQQELENTSLNIERETSTFTESSQSRADSTENQATFEEHSSTESTEEELEPRSCYKLYMKQKQLEKEFQRHGKDTGSSEVQVARLTARINHLTEHAKEHKHDYAAIRGLIGMVNKRKRLLKYLRRYGDERVIQLAEQLNIRVSRELVESRK
ncbi:30S ribosomal protein S15 [Galdieria sulphuraria]|uniref:30S ribosomal protein S15 (Plastid) n=1 Tax=Galdieria sulphuraria TaxID=130081 RepID=M2VU78_GALSU|nr:30S ribosomal protein S15 [Galdieria sulphuraria]EME26746.1 30S ribosomal protein S15 [Galdieria sulphuraria]GJD07018.1 30S ribosomal protein S15 [Galdieria sulphuraria]|eukprot:XP_005703266.1 30S ribosomal protein S15 [Galdieria sulphuraria]